MSEVRTGYSYIEYVGDGVTDTYSVHFTIGYLRSAFVTCQVNNEEDGIGNPMYRSLTFLPGDLGMVQIAGTVPGVGEPIVFRRVIPKDLLMHMYSNGSILDYPSLDESHLQLMMALHEVLDGFGFASVQTDINMNGNRILNVLVDESEPDSAATVGFIGTYKQDALDAAVAAADSALEALGHRDSAEDAAASALASAEAANIASSTVAYYNHEGTLLTGEDTISLPWAYDTEVGVEVFLAGVKQAESSLTFTDPYTVTLDAPVAADTAFEVVASAGARSDLADTLAAPGGAGLVGVMQHRTGSPSTVRAELASIFESFDTVRPVAIGSISGIASAGLKEGATCVVGGTVFEITSARPRDIRIPIISAGAGLYAVPSSGSVDTRLGSLTFQTSITDAAKYSTAQNRGHQGCIIDNQNQRLFLSAVVLPDANPQKGYIYEYGYTGGVLGALIASSGLLTIGHGDFLAMTAESGVRYLWFYKPLAGTYSGGGSICRVPWAAGITDASIDRTISTAGFFDTRRAEVQNYDADHISLRGVNTYICRIDDLNSGNLSPVKTLPYVPTPINPIATQPQQQFGHMAGWWHGFSGVLRAKPKQSFLAIANAGGEAFGADYTGSTADVEAEIEGVAWRWNAKKVKYDIILSDVRWTAGQVSLYIANTGGDFRYAINYPLFSKVYNIDLDQFNSTVTQVLEAPGPLAAPAILVGGIGNKDTLSTYSPADFVIEQWTNETGGRQGARINLHRAAGGPEIRLDGPADSTVPTGVRVAIGSASSLQVDALGISIGDITLKSATRPAQVEISNSLLPSIYVHGGTAGICSAAAASGSDFTVPDGQGMQFGSLNLTTGATTNWHVMTLNALYPNNDNTKTLGLSGNRWSTIYAGTGTINTSDVREKRDARELSQAEEKVAKRLKKMVRAFRFNDAVAEKGENARIHFGLMAQEVGDAFREEGLDPHRYAMFCYDEWQDTYDDNGEEMIQKAGNRYGIRYDELFAFVLSAL